MTENDLTTADALRQAAGWNQLRQDWERLLEHDPDGCFVAESDGAVVGTATTTSFGRDLAWIGMVLVHPEQRRRGIGKSLLQHCLRCLDDRGIRCIKLDATPLGRTLYCQIGFDEEWSLSRWEGETPKESESIAAQVRAFRDDDMEWVEQFDAAMFGVSRSRLLRKLAQQSDSVLVDLSCRGYGMVRRGSRASYIGPVMADSAATGRALVKALLQAAPARQIYWDIPDPNTAAVALAEEIGFRRQRPLLRMFRGPDEHPGQPLCCYAIADPATG